METNLQDVQNGLNVMKEYINHKFENCEAVYNDPEQLGWSLYHLAQSASELIQLCGYLSAKIERQPTATNGNKIKYESDRKDS